MDYEKLSRQLANIILSRVKAGTHNYPAEVVTMALWVTGDLE